MEKLEVPEQFCKEILEFDTSVRFAGIIDKFGKLVTSEYRKHLIPLLSKEESVRSIQQSMIRMGSRKILQPRLGRLVYAFAYYEKVKRATIPMYNDSTLLVSFDVEADHDSIIMKKIVPLIKKHSMNIG